MIRATPHGRRERASEQHTRCENDQCAQSRLALVREVDGGLPAREEAAAGESHDAAKGEDLFVTLSPVKSEQVGAAAAWMRRIASVPPTTVTNARAWRSR